MSLHDETFEVYEAKIRRLTTALQRICNIGEGIERGNYYVVAFDALKFEQDKSANESISTDLHPVEGPR